MDFLKENKVPILAGVLLLAGIYVYMTYFAGSSAPATLTASDADATLSQHLLDTLQNLHTIKLDNAIFAEPTFQSLTDFGVIIPLEAVGRRNPFVPLVNQGGGGGLSLPLPKAGH